MAASLMRGCDASITTSLPAARTTAPCSDSMTVSCLNVFVASRRSSSARTDWYSFMASKVPVTLCVGGGNGTQEAQEAQEETKLLVPLVLLVFRSLLLCAYESFFSLTITPYITKSRGIFVAPSSLNSYTRNEGFTPSWPTSSG